MTSTDTLSRRSFLALTAITPFAVTAASRKQIPVGLELYSVRNELEKDVPGTLDAVAKMGYECVEFYSPYYDWTPEDVKKVRTQLDTLKLRCYSTHNGLKSFKPDGIERAIELNKALDGRYVVLADPGEISDIDGWKRIAETLNTANDTLKSHGLHAGYHNHQLEWKAIRGQKPMEVLAANTDKSIMLQLDVGTCLETGNDPVAWINQNPGRIRSMHCKDWSPEKGYRVLVGQGVAPWKKIFEAAEKTGGIEYYLIEQEGSEYPETETAERCLVAFHDLHG
jgi:sugar phosphate isomerase/epimerase